MISVRGLLAYSITQQKNEWKKDFFNLNDIKCCTEDKTVVIDIETHLLKEDAVVMHFR